jgi:uncharacterized protein
VAEEGDTGGWPPPDLTLPPQAAPAPFGDAEKPVVMSSRPRPDFAPPLEPVLAQPGHPGGDGHAGPPHGPGPYGLGPYGPGPYGQPPPYGPHPYGQPPVRRPWAVEAPPGTPYHQLARTPVQRWWRPIVGTGAILLAGLGALMPIMLVWILLKALISGMSVRLIAEFAGEEKGPLLRDPNALLGFTLLSVAVFLPFILLAAWVFQRRRPGSLSSVTGRLRLRWLLICAGLSVLTSVVSFVCAWLASLAVHRPVPQGSSWVGWGAFAVPLLIVVLLVPFQASAEEYFFRGWLLQAIGSCTLETRTGRVARTLSTAFRTPWPAICISGLAFVSVHGYTGWGVLAIFGFAAITGWLTVRTGGLEAAIAIHVVNNMVAFLLPAAVGRLSLEQGAIPWPYVLADLAPLLLYAVVVDRLARRRELETVSAPAGGPAPATV